MTKKRLILIASLPLTMALMLPLLWYLSLDGRFREAIFDQIEEGMSEHEVEAILGLPAGDYRSLRVREAKQHRLEPIGYCKKESGLSGLTAHKRQQDDILDWSKNGMPDRPLVTEKRWLGNTWGMVIVFDEKGQVIHRRLLAMLSPK